MADPTFPNTPALTSDQAFTSNVDTRTDNALRSRPLDTKVGDVDPLVAEAAKPNAWETASATWRRETIIGQVLSNAGIDPSRPDDENFGNEWNPYSYFKRNAKEFGDIEQYVLTGHVDNVKSEEGFKSRAALIRKQMADEKTIAEGGMVGTIAGMGMSLLDVTSLIPASKLGLIAKAGRLGRAAESAAIVAGQQGITELGLQATDHTRTAEESFQNLAFAGVLGAGVGAILPHTGHPASKLNPDHPNNPLRPNAPAEDTFHVTRPGQTVEEGVTVTAGDVGDSVGAARVMQHDTERLAPDGAIASMIDKVVTKTFGQWTPVSRMWNYFDKGRDVMQNLVDSGGVLSQGVAKGRAIISAEDIQRSYLSRYADVADDIQHDLRTVNMAMGQGGAETTLKTQGAILSGGKLDKNRVPSELYMEAVHRRALMDEHVANDHAFAPMQYGEWFSGRFGQAGFDPQQVDALRQAVDGTAGKVRDFYKRFSDDAVKHGLLDAEDLKGGYVPQLYNKTGINRDPEGFKRAMSEHLIDNPPADWLAENHVKPGAAEGAVPEPLTLKDFKALDDRARAEILSDWRGAWEQAQAAKSASAFESASANLARVKDEFAIISHGMDVAKGDVRKASVASLKAGVRASEANWFAKRLGWAQGKIERAQKRIDELSKDYPDLAGMADDTARTMGETGERVVKTGDATHAANAAMSEAAALEHDLRITRRKAGPTAEPVDPVKFEKASSDLKAAIEARRAAREELSAAQGELRSAARDSRNANKWHDAVVARIDEHKGNLETVEKSSGTKAALEVERERLDSLRSKLGEAEGFRRQMATEAGEVRKGLSISRKELRAASRDSTKAKRWVDKVKKSTPMYQYLDDLTNALRGGERAPQGLLLDKVGETNRLKERRFNFSPELHERMRDEGFIEKDPMHLMDRYQADMGGRLALQQKFGDHSLESTIAEIRTQYDVRADALRRDGRMKDAEAVSILGDKNVKDVRAMRDRILGHSSIGGDGDEKIVWLAEKVRQLGFIGQVGGFVLSAIGDLATGIMSTAGFLPGAIRHFNSYSKLLEKARAGDPDFRELKAILASIESGPQFATSTRAYQDQAARAELGFGDGNVRRVTANIDKYMRIAGDRGATYSGLAAYSNSIRRVAALTQLDNIAHWLKTYGSDAKIVADLGGMGIGEVEAKRLKVLFEKYGSKDGDLFNPGTSKWLKEEDGDRMINVLETALQRTQRRASYVPGYGTVPVGMNKWYAAMLLQFQSYAFTFTNNFIQAGVQRATALGDTRFYGAAGMSIAMGGLVATMKAFMRGDDPAKWENSKWVNELVTRSGMLGWTQPYVDSGSKLFGAQINNLAGMNLLQPSTKFQRNSWTDSLLGPWAGVVKTTGQAAAAAGEGEFLKAAQLGSRFVPLNQQFKLGHALTNFIAP